MLATNSTLKPLKLWQSALLFLGPGIYGAAAFYLIFPALQEWGMSAESAYNTVHLSVFLLLFVIAWIVLKGEGSPIGLFTLKDRLMFKGMSAKEWGWTAAFTILYLALGYLLGLAGQFIYDLFGFVPPDADIPLTKIPFLLIVFAANITSEELLWRGVILPRQELEHGKKAWIVNGILWSFFHMFKWWAVPFMLLKQWMLPFLSQRTGNNTPALMIHFISNGIGILIILLPLLS